MKRELEGLRRDDGSEGVWFCLLPADELASGLIWLPGHPNRTLRARILSLTEQGSINVRKIDGISYPTKLFHGICS